jgi:hypothetical protein
MKRNIYCHTTGTICNRKKEKEKRERERERELRVYNDIVKKKTNEKNCYKKMEQAFTNQ